MGDPRSGGDNDSTTNRDGVEQMSEAKVYPVPAAWARRAWIDAAGYEQMYRRSIDDSEAFWREQGGTLQWIRPFTKVKNTSFARDAVSIKWFEDGALNVSANCLDRHLETRGDQTAILWEGDDPKESRRVSYRELHAEVPGRPRILVELCRLLGDELIELLQGDGCRVTQCVGPTRTTWLVCAILRI